jgi:hypothetical protein
MIGLAVPLGCAPAAGRPPPSTPTPDPRFAVGRPSVSARSGASGAPVDCAVDVVNRSGKTLARLLVSCELLDSTGVPIGTGLGTAFDVRNGETRPIRTVVYGVREFASARAVVTGAIFAESGG